MGVGTNRIRPVKRSQPNNNLFPIQRSQPTNNHFWSRSGVLAETYANVECRAGWLAALARTNAIRPCRQWTNAIRLYRQRMQPYWSVGGNVHMAMGHTPMCNVDRVGWLRLPGRMRFVPTANGRMRFVYTANGCNRIGPLAGTFIWQWVIRQCVMSIGLVGCACQDECDSSLPPMDECDSSLPPMGERGSFIPPTDATDQRTNAEWMWFVGRQCPSSPT
jgi:hypothetical protein